MTAPPISRYPVPKLEDLPEDIRARILAVQEKAGFIPNVFLTLAHRPAEFRAFFAYHDALMEKEGGLTKAEREMIVVATSGRQRLPVLHRRARRDPAHLREEPAGRRPGRGQLPQGRHHAAAEGDARVRAQGRAASSEIGDDDFAALRAHGFTDEDIWDIGAIAAFFALSNRMANLIGMRPNDEFFLMGRVPREQKSKRALNPGSA